MTEQVWWYATRAAGIMTWSTAMASVLLGLLLSSRALGKKPSGPWLLDVHRFLGGLSAVFLLIHLGSLWADSYVDFGPKELLVPGQSTWNPSADWLGVSAVSWGIGAAYALIAVEITSILRRFMRPSIWRRAHYLSVVTVVFGTVHGWRAGTDVDNPVVTATAVGSSILVVLLTLIRLRKSPVQEDTEHEQMLEVVRQRLEDMPIPDVAIQPQVEELSVPDLPRRDRPPVEESQAQSTVADQILFEPADQPEPDAITSEGENTLLAGLDGITSTPPPDSLTSPPDLLEPAAQLGPDPFAHLQGSDDFDPGGWSTEGSHAARQAFPDVDMGEFAGAAPAAAGTPPADLPDRDDEFSLTHADEAEPPVDFPPPNATAPEHEPELDPRSFLSELEHPPPPPEPRAPLFDPHPSELPTDEMPAMAPVDQSHHAGPPPPPPPPELGSPPPIDTEPPRPPPPPDLGTPPPSDTEPPPPPPDLGPPPPIDTEPPPAAQPREPLQADRAQVNVWETALESLLGETPPNLPTSERPPAEPAPGFEAPPEPSTFVSPVPSFEASPEPISEPPPAAPASPARPVVEPLDAFEPPRPVDPPPVVNAMPTPPETSTRDEPAAPTGEPDSFAQADPPPLPVHAIDPATGETDEQAYKDWLVEWLAYAERYGDETPIDPSRVDG